MSRLYRQMRSLESLEMNQIPNRPRPLMVTKAESGMGQERAASATAQAKETDYPLYVYPAFQWKYDVDESSPWWKKMYFRFVWLPFARFSYFRVKIIPFERVEPDGSLSWKEDQGAFLRERDAEREASKYAYGGYRRVYFNAPEAKETITGRTHFPTSTAYLDYEESLTKEERRNRDKYREVLREAQTAIDRFRSRATQA